MSALGVALDVSRTWVREEAATAPLADAEVIDIAVEDGDVDLLDIGAHWLTDMSRHAGNARPVGPRPYFVTSQDYTLQLVRPYALYDLDLCVVSPVTDQSTAIAEDVEITISVDPSQHVHTRGPDSTLQPLLTYGTRQGESYLIPYDENGRECPPVVAREKIDAADILAFVRQLPGFPNA